MLLMVFCLMYNLQIQNILNGFQDMRDPVKSVFVNTSSDSPAMAIAELPLLKLLESCKIRTVFN